MHPRAAPKQVLSRRKAQPWWGPGEALQQRAGLFWGLTRRAGVPKDAGGVLRYLPRQQPRLARRAYPSALGHPGAGALNCLSRSDAMDLAPATSQVLRVRLTPALTRPNAPESPHPMLDAAGPLVCLGSAPSLDGLATPVAPAAASMFGPRGACLVAPQGPLWVSDTGNNRVMVWQQPPRTSGADCDLVIGQNNAHLVDNNQSLYWPTCASLNMLYGICAAGDFLLVSDTANSRLIGWHFDECDTGAPARTLSGQPGFSAKGDNPLANAGARQPVLALRHPCQRRHGRSRGLGQQPGAVVAHGAGERVMSRRAVPKANSTAVRSTEVNQ